MKQNRIATLKNAGVDTSKYFTLTVEQDLPKGTKISFAIETENNPVAKEIIESGYVRNTKLHRRFVAAHYMRLLNSPHGWHRAMNHSYDYMYQYDMMLEEVRVLSKLRHKDWSTFFERETFFTVKVVCLVLEQYMDDLRKYLSSLKIRHCKGKPYIRIPRYRDMFIENLNKDVYDPLESMLALCKRTAAYDYDSLYERFKVFRKLMIPLPYNTKKSKVWINTFQAAGAFYTLKNLIMFHDVKLYYNDRFYDAIEGMNVLDGLKNHYEGYQMNGLLKETIKQNNFDFNKSIEAHK